MKQTLVRPVTEGKRRKTRTKNKCAKDKDSLSFSNKNNRKYKN